MGARVVGLLAKFAKVVVVCSEDIAAVVALALNFTNNVEALVVLIPVSSTASFARLILALSAADAAARKILSTCSCV